MKTYPEIVDDDITYKVLYSSAHDFKYDEAFHPGRGHEVVLRGWRAIIKASAKGFEATANAVLGLSKEDCEACAREGAREALYSKIINRKEKR